MDIIHRIRLQIVKRVSAPPFAPVLAVRRNGVFIAVLRRGTAYSNAVNVRRNIGWGIRFGRIGGFGRCHARRGCLRRRFLRVRLLHTGCDRVFFVRAQIRKDYCPRRVVVGEGEPCLAAVNAVLLLFVRRLYRNGRVRRGQNRRGFRFFLLFLRRGNRRFARIRGIFPFLGVCVLHTRQARPNSILCAGRQIREHNLSVRWRYPVFAAVNAVLLTDRRIFDCNFRGLRFQFRRGGRLLICVPYRFQRCVSLQKERETDCLALSIYPLVERATRLHGAFRRVNPRTVVLSYGINLAASIGIPCDSIVIDFPCCH